MQTSAFSAQEAHVQQLQRRPYLSDQYQTNLNVSPRSQTENDIKFLKTFFSGHDRQVNDSVIESVLA